MVSCRLKITLLVLLLLLLNGCGDIKGWEEYHKNIARQLGLDPKQLLAPTEGTYYKFKHTEIPDKILIAHKNILRIDLHFSGFAFWTALPSADSGVSATDQIEVLEPQHIESLPARFRTKSGVIRSDNKSLIIRIKPSQSKPYICTIQLQNLKIAFAEKVSWFQDPWGRSFAYQHVAVGGGQITLRTIVNYDYNPPKKYIL